MSQPTFNCQPDRLSDLLVGTLSDIESDAMLSHLETCPQCQSRLEQLAARDADWERVGGILGSSSVARSRGSATEEFPRPRDRSVNWTESLSKKLLQAPSHPEMLGRIGRYDIERFVGAGGMGIVFKGFDTELNRPVAIKVLSPSLAFNGTARQRFAREARAAAAVVHEHVVAIHNVESNGELPFLVMHFAQGESLQAKLDREGPLELKQILRIGKQIASGLAAAHAQGLVHRDIKPANVLLEEGIDRALLTDFGLAQTADDASLTCSGYLPGTPQYMSPEQARGEKVASQSDLFSTGSVLYAMCTGRPPFRAETSLGVLQRINSTEPKNIRELNPDLPQWLCRIVERLMAKRPEDRYSSAQELSEILEVCLAHVQQPLHVPLPTSLRVPSSLAMLGERLRRRPFQLIVGTLLFALIGLVLWPRVEGIEPNENQNTKVAPPPESTGNEHLSSAGSSMEVGSSFAQSPKAAEYVLWSGPPLSKVPQDDIRAKLEDAYSASWQNQSLEVVLGDVLGSAQIQFDIRPNTTTTLEKKPTVTLNMTASRRNLLRRILREFDLTYIVQEGSLEIVDLDYAKKNPTLHRYDLSYVTSNSNEANALKGTIMSVIEPNEWSVYGGNCSMGLFGPILHVRATEEMHHQIATLLSKISR